MFQSGFQEITNPAEIQKTLDDFMRGTGSHRANFIAGIHVKGGEDWNGWRVTPGGLVIEGSKPIAAVTNCETNERSYTLSNGDSGYSYSIGSIRLEAITKLELLR